MPLVYLLYRCPRCGHDPMKGEKDEAVCPGCGAQYSRGGQGGLISVQDSSGQSWEVPSHRLTAAMDAWTEKDGSPSGLPDTPRRIAEVEVRQSGAEAPVKWGGELLGFAESMGEPVPRVLELTDEAVILRMDAEGGAGPAEGTGASEGGNSPQSWSLLEIRAVQTSSSSLQFSPSTGGLVQFRLLNDSPFRWEALLREALQRAYQKEGLGKIVEFQPRIVAE